MYYPIIDKLKEVMSDVTRLVSKEDYIFDAHLTGATTGVIDADFADVAQSIIDGNTSIMRIIIPLSTIHTYYLYIPMIGAEVDNNNTPTAVFSGVFNFNNALVKIVINSTGNVIIGST